MDWTKYQTIRRAYKVEDWHDGGFSYRERHGVFYMPHEPIVDFRPLYKLTAEELGIRVSLRTICSGSSLAGLKGEITLQTPWTTVEALMEDGLESVSQITQWRIK